MSDDGSFDREQREYWDEAAAGLEASRRAASHLHRAGLELAGRRDRPAAGPAGARASRRARRDRASGGGACGAGRQRRCAATARRRWSRPHASAPRSSAWRTSSSPRARRRMDRPGGGERGRRDLPLGLHARDRSRRGAARNAPGACGQAGGWRSRCGTRRSATPGPASAHRRDARARAARSAAEPGSPGPFALRRDDAGAAARAARGGGLPEVRIEALDSRGSPPDFDSYWETRLDFSRVLHDAVLSQPAAEIGEIEAERRAPPGARTPAPDGGLAVPARTLVAAAGA